MFALLLSGSAVRLALSGKEGINLITMKGQIENYFRKARQNHVAMSMGISSYGTAITICSEELPIDVKLSAPTATINTTGVIGHRIDAQTKKLIAVFSSIKGASSTNPNPIPIPIPIPIPNPNPKP